MYVGLCYAYEESDDVINSSTEIVVKHWIKNISRDIRAVFFKLGTRNHQKCTSQKKQNDTYYVIAIGTLLAPVSLCVKPISPFETFQSGTEGLARNTLGSHIALTVPVRLLGVDDPYLRKNIILGILVLIKTGPVP